MEAGTGEVLVELAEFLGTQTNNVAEYEGVIAGLAAAREIDPQAEIEARLDSKLVVEQLTGGWAIKNATLQTLARKAKALAPANQVRFTWVPRAQNKRADALANESMDAAAAGRPARIERWLRAAGDDDPYVDAADHEAEGRTTGHRIVGWSRADLGVPTTFLVVRHGVTQQSVEHRFSGLHGADPALLELGHRQAGAAAAELARRGGADLVVTSPLQRTRQTAQIIAEQLALAGPVVVNGLAETDFGEWDSLSFSEVKAGWPDELEAWLTSFDVPAPGGESFADVGARVELAKAKLLTRYARKRVVVVTHVTPIKVLVQGVLGAPVSSAYRFELAPCSLTTMSWWPDGVSTVFGLGESGHLHGVMHDTA